MPCLGALAKHTAPPSVGDQYLERTTVWSFPDRGCWNGHNGGYRGNWSPHVPRNLILRYTRPGDVVLDPMCGGGTTLVEAQSLGRIAIGLDVNPSAVARAQISLAEVTLDPTCVKLGDARTLEGVEPASVDLVALHPPYANIIRYSSDTPGDLSCLTVPTFLSEMQRVAHACFRVLRPGGHLALLIGDTRRKGDIVPLSFRLLSAFLEADFVLQDHAIKIQHNTTSSRIGWKGRYPFLLLAHENLFIFRKGLG